jgi:hypothetical protein
VELRAIPQASKEKRPLGPGVPGWEIPDAFFDPLSDEELREWEGGSL